MLTLKASGCPGPAAAAGTAAGAAAGAAAAAVLLATAARCWLMVIPIAAPTPPRTASIARGIRTNIRLWHLVLFFLPPAAAAAATRLLDLPVSLGPAAAAAGWSPVGGVGCCCLLVLES
jgi:hypothetical protein